MKLKNKNIVLIGASGGIGRELAKELHAVGAVLWLVARNLDPLEDLRRELGDSDRALVSVFDATKPADMETLFARAQRVGGVIDAVIISAGTHRPSNIDDSVQNGLVLANSLERSLYLPTRVAGHVAQQFFRKQGGGYPWLISISSHAAVRPDLPDNLDYSPTKAKVRSFMLNLASQLAGTGIRITDIQPATVNVSSTRDWILSKGQDPADAVQPKDIADWIIQNFDEKVVPLEKPFLAKFGDL